MFGAVISLKLLGITAMQRWQSYFHQCCTSGIRRAKNKFFLRILFFSVGLMKKLTFSKAKKSIFLVNPVSAEETMPALFSVIYP